MILGSKHVGAIFSVLLWNFMTVHLLVDKWSDSMKCTVQQEWQLHLLKLRVVHLAANNYMFRPLYGPSSGGTPCYKVTTQYTACLLSMTRSRSQNFVAWTNINSSEQTQSALDNHVQSNATRLRLGWAPYTLVQVLNPIAAELYYFEHCYQEHFCIRTTRINDSPCYRILWTRSRLQQKTHFISYSYFITRSSTTWRWPI